MIMQLPVTLTEEELSAKRDELAQCASDLNSTEQEKASVASGFNAKIKELRSNMTELATSIRSKHEYRDVGCEEVPDYDAGVARTRRLDTGEFVATRVLRDEEKQRRFNLVDLANVKQSPTEADKDAS
jgi:hypothetical protein